MGLRHAVRFFVVVPLVSRSMLVTFAAVCAGGIAAVVADASHASRALAPVLLLQLFAASSGFAVPARRGHYDLLFTAGTSRVIVALTHWLMSSLPGVLAWLALATTERAAGGAALTSSGTVALLALVSTMPWALTVPLPRLSGAIVWLVLGLTVAAVAGGTRADTDPLPWDWVGLQVRRGVLAAAVVAAGLAVASAVEWIRRIDIALDSGQ